MHATHPKPAQLRTREAHLRPRRQQRRQLRRAQLRPLRRQRARRPVPVALPAQPDLRAQRAQAVGAQQPAQRLLRLVRAQDGAPSCGPAHRPAGERRPERAACVVGLSMRLKEGVVARSELRQGELRGEAREPARGGAWRGGCGRHRTDLLLGSSDLIGSSDLVGSSDGRRIGHLARQRRVLEDVERATRAQPEADHRPRLAHDGAVDVVLVAGRGGGGGGGQQQRMHRECEHMRAYTHAVTRLLRHVAEQQQVLMVKLECIRAAPAGDETLIVDQGRARCRGR